MKQRPNSKGIKGKVISICNDISRELCAICQMFHKKSKSNRFRVEKKFLLEDRTIRIFSRQADPVRPESSLEIVQLRQERDHLSVHGRNLEADTTACQQRFVFLKLKLCQKKKMDYFEGGSCSLWISKSSNLSKFEPVKR